MPDSSLNDILYALYITLVKASFLSDVYLDCDEEIINVWEASFSLEIPISSFDENTANNAITAFQRHRSEHPIEQQDLEPLISKQEATKLAMQYFGDADVLHWHIMPVDLATQYDLFTEVDPKFYQRSAWKVWLIEKTNEELPNTDNFFIAVPLPQAQIIQ